MPGHWSFYNGVMIETNDVLRLLMEKHSSFNWFRLCNVSEDSAFVGESKSPVVENLNMQFRYIVRLVHNEERNYFQFSISHNKFFYGLHESSCRFNAGETEFMLAQQLLDIIKENKVLPIYFNLPINDEWMDSLRGLHTFLSSLT